MPFLTDAQVAALNRADPNTIADILREASGATGWGTVLNQVKGSVPFVSTEQTGTGAPQNVAHGQSDAPTAVLIVPTEVPDNGYGAAIPFDIAEGVHTTTNVVVTVTATVKFKVLAFFVPA